MKLENLLGPVQTFNQNSDQHTRLSWSISLISLQSYTICVPYLITGLNDYAPWLFFTGIAIKSSPFLYVSSLSL